MTLNGMWFALSQSSRWIAILAVIGGSTSAMANNVTVRTEANEIIVRGDAASNDISVSQNANGNLVVTGNNGTRVNGRSSFTSSRRFVHVEILMGSGDDIVRLQTLNVPGDLGVYLGPGNNEVIGTSMGNIVGRSLDIYGGNQRDSVSLANWAVVGSIDIDLFNGPSVVSVESSIVGGSLDVYGGDEADSVTLTDVSVELDIDVESFGARDVINVSASDARALDIVAGSGSDSIDVSDVSLRTDLEILSGSGNDTVTVQTVSAERDVDVLLGSGNDLLSATNLIAFRDLLLNGQAGNQDTLLEGGVEGFRETEIFGFEIRN